MGDKRQRRQALGSGLWALGGKSPKQGRLIRDGRSRPVKPSQTFQWVGSRVGWGLGRGRNDGRERRQLDSIFQRFQNPMKPKLREPPILIRQVGWRGCGAAQPQHSRGSNPGGLVTQTVALPSDLLRLVLQTQPRSAYVGMEHGPFVCQRPACGLPIRETANYQSRATGTRSAPRQGGRFSARREGCEWFGW